MLKIAKIALVSAMLTAGLTGCGDNAPDASIPAKVYADGVVNSDLHKMLSVMDLSDVSKENQKLVSQSLGEILNTTKAIAAAKGGFAKYVVTDITAEGNEAVANVKFIFKDGSEVVSAIPMRLSGDNYAVVLNQARAEETAEVAAEDLVPANAEVQAAPAEQAAVPAEQAAAPAAEAKAQ
ncbi:hypothetical protein [Anaerobiospirillum succiniciproducens]|uniref:hypothetical protein n=1 Tax=Anaerobiospirillum succiniciproducens TaxID=13335 RepID=UPI00248F32C1|nr:hypothetical protein [Anaerobiospirillum succiniciproducens]